MIGRGFHLCLALAAAFGATQAGAAVPDRGLLQLHRTVFGPEDGLPSETVGAVVPSHTGHLWVISSSGLARFDGARFEIQDGRLPLATGESVASVMEDSAGDAWLATSAGALLRLRSSTGQADVVLAASSRGSPTGIHEAGGAVWMGSRRGLVAIRGGEVVEMGPERGIPEGEVGAVAADGEGRVWAATARGLRLLQGDRFVDPPAQVRSALGEEPVFPLLRARDGGLWTCGVGWCAKIPPGGGPVVRYGRAQGLPELSTAALLEDRQGNLWVGLWGGLARIRGGKVEGPFRASDGLPGDDPVAFAEDGEGNVWVGFFSGGLARFRATVAVTFGQYEGLLSDNVLALAEGDEGDIWVGTSAGLGRVRQGKALATRVQGRPVSALARGPEGTIWAAAPHAILRIRGEEVREVARSTFLVTALELDAAGTLWVGTIRGLASLEGGRLVPAATSGALASDRIGALRLAPDGTLWAVAEGGGPFRHVAGRWEPVGPAGAPPGTVFAPLLADADGTVWVGSSVGLWRLRQGRWAGFGLRHGLGEAMVAAILDDGRGRLWLGGRGGLERVERADLDEVAAGRRATLAAVRYGLADGIRSLEVNASLGSCALRTAAGILWFATPRGASAVDPALERQDPRPPPAALLRASADGAALATADAVHRLGPGLRRVEIHFGAVSLSAADRLRFRYRLGGFDAGWQEAGADRLAHYTNLPPGRYLFEAQASLAGGPWSPASRLLAFEVRPHLWERAWFLPAAVALLALAAALAARRRERGHQARARELSEAARAAVAEIRTLRGMLPVCAWCKKIRDDAGSWQQIEAYVRDHSHAEFSHGMCPECYVKHYPEEEQGRTGGAVP